MTATDGSVGESPALSTHQAYEAAYRFVAQYYERERIVPLLLMLVAMEPKADHYLTNDPASWSDWEKCVELTLADAPLPVLSPPLQD
jgi:hypothetical protein